MKGELVAHIELAQRMHPLLAEVETVAQRVVSAFNGGHALYAFGNGGSASDALHLCAELVGRYRRERAPLPAVALSASPSALTCIGNDYSFDDVFSRQVQALVKKGDVVVAITTSGRSPNVLSALKAALNCGAITVLLTGDGGREVSCDHALAVPSSTTARIQEMHVLLIHLLCERIDELLVGAPE